MSSDDVIVGVLAVGAAATVAYIIYQASTYVPPPPPPTAPPLVVQAPTVSPNPVVTGTGVAIAENASGGTPPYTYSWYFDVKGVAQPGNVATYSFTPHKQGRWNINVLVTDSAGVSARSAATQLRVT